MNAALLLSVVMNAVAIEHVRVEVGDGRLLEDVTVVIEDERIVSVGQVAAPLGATRIDGRGKTLTPGFLDVVSPLGLKEVDQEPSTVDESLSGVAMVPASRRMGSIRCRCAFLWRVKRAAPARCSLLRVGGWRVLVIGSRSPGR